MVNKTTLLFRIGRAIGDQVGVWLGPVDVAGGLARAIEARDVAGLVISWNFASGVKVTPDLLPELAVALNRIAGQDGGDGAITAMAIKRALVTAFQETFGIVGTVTVTMAAGDLRLTVRQAGPVAAERRAA